MDSSDPSPFGSGIAFACSFCAGEIPGKCENAGAAAGEGARILALSGRVFWN
jgi:hypothetical protein